MPSLKEGPPPLKYLIFICQKSYVFLFFLFIVHKNDTETISKRYRNDIFSRFFSVFSGFFRKIFQGKRKYNKNGSRHIIRVRTRIFFIKKYTYIPMKTGFPTGPKTVLKPILRNNPEKYVNQRLTPCGEPMRIRGKIQGKTPAKREAEKNPGTGTRKDGRVRKRTGKRHGKDTEKGSGGRKPGIPEGLSVMLG